MDSATFRRHGYELVDWIAGYLEHPDRYPILARVKPGEITNALPTQAPEDPETFESIMADFERLLVPGLTHWNHPGFFAYFATTATAPGVLAEFLSAALNQQARVDILGSGAGPFSLALADVLLNAFRTNVGDALISGYANVTVDVSSLLAANTGQTLRLRFAEVDNVGPFQFGVDNVSLEAETTTQLVPEPASLLLLGSGLAAVALRRRRR